MGDGEPIGRLGRDQPVADLKCAPVALRGTEWHITSLGMQRLELERRPADAWFTIAEAAVYTGLATRTLRNAVSQDRLRVDGRSTGPLFRRRTLDQWLAARQLKAFGNGVDDG